MLGFSLLSRERAISFLSSDDKKEGGEGVGRSGLLPTDIGQLYRMLEREREKYRKRRRDGE